MVSLVYAAPRARFYPSISAIVHFAVLPLAFSSVFAAMDSLASLEAF
jgi:hypothetical protein